MPKFKTDDNLIRILLISLLVFIFYSFILVPLGFMLPVRLNSNDAILSLLKLTKQKEEFSNEILVIKIDEESLAEVGKKWPWDRLFTAEALDKIASYKPKVIAVDLVLFGKSINPEEDNKLAESIRNAGNVILPGNITEKKEYVPPYAPFVEAAYGVGFVNKIIDPDFKTRRALIAFKSPVSLQTYFSFETVIAAAYSGISKDNIKPEKEKVILNQDFYIPIDKNNSVFINYLPLQVVPAISLIDLLQDKIKEKNILEGKMVLLGSTSKTSHDISQTPHGIIPGVFLNAFTLNTILKQNFLINIRNDFFLPLALFLTLLTAFFSYRLSLPKGIFLFLAEIILIILGFYAALAYKLKSDYFSLLFLPTLAYIIANSYKYGYLIYFSNKLKMMVMTDSITGLATARYFQFKLQLDLSKTIEAKSGISIVIFNIPQLQELSKEHRNEQIELLLRQLGITLKQNSRKKVDLLSRWKEDKFAAILLKTSIEEANTYTQKIISKIEENEFFLIDRALHLTAYAGVSNYPSTKTESAAGLIACAEAASGRAKLSNQKICIFNPRQDKVHVDILQKKTLTTETEYLTMDIADREKELLETLNELKKSRDEIQNAHFETILSLVKALEEKDTYTAGHSERVANYAVGIAKQLGIEDPELTLIRQSALLHDVGKFGLSDKVLHKKEALTQDEIDQIKKHPVMGERILEKSKFFENHIPLIVHHHERYDGKGYPHGLSGKFIPKGAQIIAIADAVDAMTTGRGYNHVLNIEETIQELKKSEGAHFDPDYVKPAIDYLLGASKR